MHPSLQQSIDNLNPQQRDAVVNVEGPMLVIAGAGSGKTRVITHRIAYLIEEKGAPPWSIFAATFTNKAAEEMKHRIARLIPGADVARLAIATFHSLCVGILRQEAEHIGLSQRFSICDGSDQKALVKDCLRSLESQLGGKIKPEEALSYIAAAKNQMLDPPGAAREMNAEFGHVFARVYALYQERLIANDAVDFDDLILHVVKIFTEHPEVLAHYQDRWRHVLVDEYQDTNLMQFELVRMLASRDGHICAVGDEDQSIYSWRGAKIENLLEFPDRFPGTQIVRLEQNYRSTESILEAADAVIAHNTQRLGKTLWSDRGQGEPITIMAGMNERDEAAQVVDTIDWLCRVRGMRASQIAIFYRINALSRVFEDHLRQRAVDYRVVGGIKFYDRAEVKDLLAYMRLAVNPRDGVALSRVINKPSRKIGEKTIDALFERAVRENTSLWDALCAELGEEKPVFNKPAKAGAALLVSSVDEWGELAHDHPPREVLEHILRDTQYEATCLGKPGSLEALSRGENIGELLSALEEYHESDPEGGIAAFLERVALVNATDNDDGSGDKVSLMSMHSAKGLEFPAVFIVGLEESIFPSKRAVNDQGSFEEERRLFYVGITRAQDLLFLTRADSRMLYGRPAYNPPSIFLREIPGDLLRSREDARRAWSDGAASRERQPERRPAMREGRRPAQGSSPAVPVEAECGIFEIGMRVAHAKLGEGEVTAVSGAGIKRKVSVRFDAGLELEILEQYGGLEIVEADGSELPF